MAQNVRTVWILQLPKVQRREHKWRTTGFYLEGRKVNEAESKETRTETDHKRWVFTGFALYYSQWQANRSQQNTGAGSENAKRPPKGYFFQRWPQTTTNRQGIDLNSRLPSFSCKGINPVRQRAGVQPRPLHLKTNTATLHARKKLQSRI
jgi:hypothetical protein